MAIKKTTNLTFGEATSRAKQGEAIARESWCGYNMFAYIIPANSYPAQTGVAKRYFGENGLVPYKEYWALKTIHDEVIPWNPYGSDVLANDWKVVEVKPKENKNE